MTCIQVRVSVPLLKAASILMSVGFFLCIKAGHGTKQPGSCKAVCIESDCITSNKDRLDFTAAMDACSNQNGKLLSFQSVGDKTIFDTLGPQELFGNFWIGLRLPAGVCSNLSVGTRGYAWTSGDAGGRFLPDFSWKKSTKLCSAHCVSVSNNGGWMEQPCSERTEGFLCKTKHKDACRAQASSNPVVFLSSEGCSRGPCEHSCKAVTGGYTCSCFEGYTPSIEDPRQCTLHCSKQSCPAHCEQGKAGPCFCPIGFVLDDKLCEDMNECDMDSHNCDQECKNTYGSFVCSCKKGYTLRKQVECVKTEDGKDLVTTPVVEEVVKPSMDSKNITAGSSAQTGGFVWIWIVVAVAVLVCIFVIRFHVVNRQKRREQTLNQQSAVPVPVDLNEG